MNNALQTENHKVVIDFAVQRDNMVWIPSGSFSMGESDGGEFERPVRTVHLDGFWMDATPVTNEAFTRFAEATGYATGAERSGKAWGYADGQYGEIPGLSWRTFALPGREDHPVVMVNWYDAQTSAEWSGKRLPTEAEWEKAAKGGLPEAQYPWGEKDPDGSQCNFANDPRAIPPTTPVREFPPNEYGLYDMVGNVWQHCSDWLDNDYYAYGPTKNPKGPDSGTFKSRRGGAWNVIQAFRLRCANRGAYAPDAVAPNIGFRCAVSE